MKHCTLLSVFLLQSIFILSDTSELEHFVEFVISPNGDYVGLDGKIIYSPHNKRHRVVRTPYTEESTCRLPDEIKDFLITCKAYPNRIICLQHCPFGYTFPEGISREMKCWHEEDKWMPVEDFEPCKPFVDCTLTLQPGGKYVCYTQYLDKGNECEVECQHFEDKAAVPRNLHRCDLNGHWTPQLPRCVRARSGIELVPPPKGQKVFRRG